MSIREILCRIAKRINAKKYVIKIDIIIDEINPSDKVSITVKTNTNSINKQVVKEICIKKNRAINYTSMNLNFIVCIIMIEFKNRFKNYSRLYWI